MAYTSRVFGGGCRALLAAAKGGGGGGAPKATAAAAAAAKGPRPGGLLKAVPVSPQLRNFLGVPEVSRSVAVKKIWEYIKLNNLQNPANKKEICCDEKLKTIFDGKDKVGFLEIARLLSHHFAKTS